jgi:hypothetical protein
MRTAEDDLREISRDFGFLIVAEAILLAAIAMVLWAVGRAPLAGTIAKGFFVFYLGVWAVFWITVFIMRALRISDDERFDAYVLGNLAAGGVPLLGWSAFAAAAVRS